MILVGSTRNDNVDPRVARSVGYFVAKVLGGVCEDATNVNRDNATQDRFGQHCQSLEDICNGTEK